MARSAHAFVRGSAVRFYEWLDAQKRGGRYPKDRRFGFVAIVTLATLARSQEATDE